MKIVDCQILFETYQNIIMVKLDTGQWVRLYSYYPDEKTYVVGEFIGKDFEEALTKIRADDVAYLRR